MARRITVDGVPLTRRIVPPPPRLLSKFGPPTDADARRFDLVLDREALSMHERRGRSWSCVWAADCDDGSDLGRLARAVLDSEGHRRPWRRPPITNTEGPRP